MRMEPSGEEKMLIIFMHSKPHGLSQFALHRKQAEMIIGSKMLYALRTLAARMSYKHTATKIQARKVVRLRILKTLLQRMK